MEMDIPVQVRETEPLIIHVQSLIRPQSAPAGFIAIVIIGFTLPSTSVQYTDSTWLKIGRQKFSLINLRRIDYIGVALLVAASILLVFAFESAGVDYAWDSAAIIVTLILGFFLFAAFIAWECWLQRREHGIVEPIFPPRILRSRLMASMFAYVI